MIFFIETTVARIEHRFHYGTGPTVEEIIDAETRYLQEEIAHHRAHQMPGRIVEQRGVYHCPECNECIPSGLVDDLKIKYCPECGKRIVKHQPLASMRVAPDRKMDDPEQ